MAGFSSADLFLPSITYFISLPANYTSSVALYPTVPDGYMIPPGTPGSMSLPGDTITDKGEGPHWRAYHAVRPGWGQGFHLGGEGESQTLPRNGR